MLQIKSKIVICHTADSKPVKQEVNGTVIPLLFPVNTKNLQSFIILTSTKCLMYGRTSAGVRMSALLSFMVQSD